jgi:thiol-disulfide isomerase/thioredoxin
MPAFEMGDLSGKTWRIKNLEGKAVLINVWATWCGPCQAELPKLEKLYQQMKDRSDFQILTFNIDSDLGLVAPFVKDKGFTFPVLPAYSRRGAAGHGGHSAELAPGSEGRLALEPIGLRLFGCGMGRNDDREARIGEGEVVPYS